MRSTHEALVPPVVAAVDQLPVSVQFDIRVKEPREGLVVTGVVGLEAEPDQLDVPLLVTCFHRAPGLTGTPPGAPPLAPPASSASSPPSASPGAFASE